MGDAEEAGTCFRVRIPAKVNLFLAVRGLRDDGYHELVSVMQTVSLYDELQAGISGPPGRGHHPAARRRMGLALRTDGALGLPAAKDNLAVLAAQALGRRTGLLEVDLQAAFGPRTVLRLDKGIPVAGGMAGGSADGAATLVALNRLWRCELDADELRAVGAELGSDVPFCLAGGTALATGRGETLAQVLSRGAYSWVVATSAEPLSTAEVYRTWDRECAPTAVGPDAVLAALRSQDVALLGAALANELEPAAFALRPELADAKKALLHAGALGAVLSGSGPTLLALCANPRDAERLAAKVREQSGDRFRDVLVARSPAGGPDLSTC